MVDLDRWCRTTDADRDASEDGTGSRSRWRGGVDLVVLDTMLIVAVLVVGVLLALLI